MRKMALGLAIGLCTAHQAFAQPPIEAYGQLPSVDLIEISPDGSKIAMVAGGDHERRFQIRSTADLKVLHGGSVGDAKVRALMWAGETHVLIATSKTASVIELTGDKHEFLLIADYNLTTDRDVQLLNGGVFGVERMLNTAAALPAVRMIDGHPVAFLEAISYPGGGPVLALVKTDLDTGGSRLAALGTSATRGWLVDKAGKIAARIDYDARDSVWKLLTLHDGHLGQSLREVTPIETPIVHGFGRDPASVLVKLPSDGGEELQYREVAFGADHASEPIAALTGGRPIHDRRTGTVVGVRRDSGASVGYTFFAPDDMKLWGQVTRAFQNAVVTLQSWSDDHRKVVAQGRGRRVRRGVLPARYDHASRRLARGRLSRGHRRRCA